MTSLFTVGSTHPQWFLCNLSFIICTSLPGSRKWFCRLHASHICLLALLCRYSIHVRQENSNSKPKTGRLGNQEWKKQGCLFWGNIVWRDCCDPNLDGLLLRSNKDTRTASNSRWDMHLLVSFEQAVDKSEDYCLLKGQSQTLWRWPTNMMVCTCKH